MITISDVIGQREVWQRLLAMHESGHVPHALLFAGPEGSGKLPMALAFASLLLNNSPLLNTFNHPDLHFSFPTIKPKGSSAEYQPVSDDVIQQWRDCIGESPYLSLSRWMDAIDADNQQAVITGAESDALGRKLALKSSQGGYKVSIVWLPEKMNATSANKLLKILEEPPQHTVFILVSQHTELLLDTIRSRTQRISFSPIATADMADALEKRRGLEEGVARRIARLANGSWNEALELLGATSERKEFFDKFVSLMRLSYQRNVGELKRWSDEMALYGREKQKRFLEYMSCQLRENFMFNFRQPELLYMTEEEERFSLRFAPFINEANIIELNALMEKAHRDIAQNASGKIVFFELALQMIVLLLKK